LPLLHPRQHAVNATSKTPLCTLHPPSMHPQCTLNAFLMRPRCTLTAPRPTHLSSCKLVEASLKGHHRQHWRVTAATFAASRGRRRCCCCWAAVIARQDNVGCWVCGCVQACVCANVGGRLCEGASSGQVEGQYVVLTSLMVGRQGGWLVDWSNMMSGPGIEDVRRLVCKHGLTPRC
jgi:hypothetical protein